MKNKILLLFVFIYSNIIFAQQYLLPNESLLYSFETKNGKTMMLAKDKKDKYIIYRFGTKSKVEFEYPEKDKSSWQKLAYSFYMRGGGAKNEGMDLNYINFTSNDFKYIIYDTYEAVGNHIEFGLKIINLKTNKKTTILGLKKTEKGSLIDFRDNELIRKCEELFD
jgi:hypothetical protein